EKVAYSRASILPVIPSKFIYVHTDEFTGELRAHAAGVGKRMTHRLISMGQTVIDAFANNFAEIMPDCWGDIFAHHIANQGQRQASFTLPPAPEIDNLLKPSFGTASFP